MKFYPTDCGRREAAPKERNDCTVRAVAACLNISYPEAHARLAALGRKPKRGVRFREPLFAGPLGLESRPDLSCKCLSTVLPEMATGRFIVRISGHCFAVVNGAVIDREEPAPLCRVKMVYEYVGAPPAN